MIDEEYATYQPTNMQEDFWETKLLKYRKQIEEQLQAELQQEVVHHMLLLSSSYNIT